MVVAIIFNLFHETKTEFLRENLTILICILDSTFNRLYIVMRGGEGWNQYAALSDVQGGADILFVTTDDSFLRSSKMRPLLQIISWITKPVT